jgi:lipopolysaccharide/colanic/teichoic acid biosynthesis glycosyltransferase
MVDVGIATVLLVLMAPALVLIALAVRVAMGPGVIYRQRRVGRDGKTFMVYKFRTMREDRRQARGSYVGLDRRQCHKHPGDPRHTPFGQFMRKLSLDELPQLANVVKGEMSLVGPRPELMSVVERYEPWQHARHAVKPGITGLWQVSEHRALPMHEATALDLEYVQQVSLGADVAILARTVPALVARRSF